MLTVSDVTSMLMLCCQSECGCRPAVDHDGVFGPVGLLTHDVDELQDALDGVDGGDAVVRPGRVVQVEHVPTLIRLQRETTMGGWVICGGGRCTRS